ncbi:MAG: hypothetical protein NDF52_05315 [archaeon YNP-WB-062]|nr:hypothetical protein [Candidatus Culexarchaeum yellowstonense]
MKTLNTKLYTYTTSLIKYIVECAGYVGMGKFSDALRLLDIFIEVCFEVIDELSGYKLIKSRMLLNETRSLIAKKKTDEAISNLRQLAETIMEEI